MTNTSDQQSGGAANVTSVTDNGDNGDNEIDTGEPILELQSLAEMPSDGFIDRIFNRINRVQLGNELTGMAWVAPWLVIKEFLTAIFGSLPTASSDQTGKSASTSSEDSQRPPANS